MIIPVCFIQALSGQNPVHILALLMYTNHRLSWISVEWFLKAGGIVNITMLSNQWVLKLTQHKVITVIHKPKLKKEKIF